jgi:hypothetical protein
MTRAMAKRPTKKSASPAANPMPAAPLAAVLSFLKDTRGVVTWTAKEMAERLGLESREGTQILAVMEMQGYVKRAEGTSDWLTTPAGEVVSGSRAPRFSAKAVEDALSALRERVFESNGNKQSPFSVVEVVAFGDFLSGSSRVQAADVALQLKRRKADAGSPSEENSARQAFLKQLRGRTAALQLREHEEWMTRRKHRRL